MTRDADGRSPERVLAWLRAHITDRELRPGDPLPREVDIAAAVGVGRSSVREALIALRVLGLVESRRHLGMRLVREPVLLDLRDWFTLSYESSSRLDEAMEFRAVIEQGLIGLISARIGAAEIAQLRRILDGVSDDMAGRSILEAETRFHKLLMKASRSRLAFLFSALLTPVFAGSDPRSSAAEWRHDHEELVATLERRDRKGFARAMRRHTDAYLRLEPVAAAARR